MNVKPRMLRLTLFGSFAASLCDAEGERPISVAPRAAELLAFLAIGRGRSYTRRDIADSVWNATQTEVTLGSVNTGLWRLRQALERPPVPSGEFLTVTRQGSIGLGGPGLVTADVEHFTRLASLSSAARGPFIDARCPDLVAALEAYRGDALADFHSPWAVRERDRLRNCYLDIARRLMQSAALACDYDAAIHYARLALAADGLREDLHRELMRLLLLDGQRANALRQFEICRSALKTELAIQPMKETFAVYHEISGNAVALAGS